MRSRLSTLPPDSDTGKRDEHKQPASDLHKDLQPLTDLLNKHFGGLSNMQFVRRVNFTVACNWKLVNDNYLGVCWVGNGLQHCIILALLLCRLVLWLEIALASLLVVGPPEHALHKSLMIYAVACSICC